ncbi:hypothetical protein HK104_000626 [Borealophlyctis nickersoniae]|nr:hypothetical protein HK104_000626 [Borealophlyctis nickersoniae]
MARTKKSKPGHAKRMAKKQKAEEEELSEHEGGTVDLYEEFSISRDASQDEIKKAYRKLALKFHPDKLSGLKSDEEKKEATAKFQEIVSWYNVLSDPVKRKRYDTTGQFEPGNDAFWDKGDAATWDEYFSSLWTKFTEKDIDDFHVKYQGSEQEQSDILAEYVKHKGNVWRILECVMFASLDEFDRIVSIIRAAIASGKVERFSQFEETANDSKELEKRRKRAAREAKEVEELLKEREAQGTGKKGKGKEQDSEQNLLALMAQRGENRMNDLVASLEAKYGNKKGKKGKAAKSAPKSPSKKADGSKKRKKDESEAEAEEAAEEDGGDEDEWENLGESEEDDEGMPTEEEFAALQAKLFAKKDGKEQSTGNGNGVGKETKPKRRKT